MDALVLAIQESRKFIDKSKTKQRERPKGCIIYSPHCLRMPKHSLVPDAAMAIQVSYNPKKSTETWERESTALIKLSKVLDCKRLIILTYELEEEIVVKDKKIEVIPVWKWLLNL